MNNLVIPPPPNWYENYSIACSPDNTVIYGSRNDIVVIYPKPPEDPADIKILPRCHRERITGVVICPSWGNPDKLAVSIAEDRVVNLLDIATCKIKLAHSGHTTRSDKLAGVTFAGHDRVISVSEDGFIVIWRWANNQLNSLTDLLGSKVKVSCVSSCPHASWLTAFGLRKGEVIVTDLRKTGRVLYRLRGHESSIISLSWCPTPYNIFPKYAPKITNIVFHKEKASEISPSEVSESILGDFNKDIRTDSTHEDASSNIQNVTEPLSSINVVKDISPTHTIAIEEDTAPKNQAVIDKMSLPHDIGGSFNSRDAIEIVYPDFKHVAKDTVAVDSTETIFSASIKEDEIISVEDLVKNKEKNVTSKSENDDEVVISENIMYVTSLEITNKSSNANIDTEKNFETAPNGTNIETISNKSNCSKEVINTDSESFKQNDSNLVEQELVQKECLPSAEISKSQESQTNSDNKHLTTVENVECTVSETINSSSKDISLNESNFSSNNETENQESENRHENFASQTEIESESAKEYLLAASARGGRSIIIWRAGTDGVKQVELNLPTKSRTNHRSHQEEKSWITLCWVTPKSLLSSSPKGELLQWNLATPNKTNGSYKWRLIHADHRKHVFGIAAPVRLHESPDDEDWRDKNLLNAWTIGRDRFILNTSLCAERKTLASFPAVFGGINCLAPSVIYPSKIAIGAGEGSCRLWDLSRPHLQYIIMAQFSDRSQHKIISLAWHPTKETVLAFGTTDGRIGFMDPCNCSKSATFLVQHANGAVHRLDWGPANGNLEHFLLYAVTGGKLIAYDINKQLDAPMVFDVCENVTQMAWKPDYSICAVATKAGHVSLFSPKMELITTFYLQNKTVRWMTWHPEATVEDDGVSPYANWLAVATNDVAVYNCTLNDGSERDYSERIVAVFNQHSRFVESLCWSSFEGGKLAVAGDDGMASIWDVKTKTLLHSCVLPKEDVITSVLWSPLDRDYIITGTKSSIIKIWKLSENPPQEKLVKKENHKILKLKDADTSSAEVEAVVENGEEIEVIEKPKKCQRRFVLGGLNDAHNRNSCSTLLRDCKRLFASHCGETNYTDESQNGEIEDDKQLDILKVFGSEQNLENVLRLEQSCNSKKKIVRSSSHISLWLGDTANAIRIAIRTRTLSPWLISMAPTVSHDLYLEACEAYADHLSEDFTSNSYEAVSYYLACHKLDKAINLLCTTKNYLEAVVLAKCRLIPTDPLIANVIERWADDSARTGNFEIAAQCYIVLGRLEEAAKVLFKRTDDDTLKFCAELAKHCDNKDFLDAVLFKLSTLEISKEEKPEVPLLRRWELEFNQQKLEKICTDSPDSGISCEKTELNDKKVDLIKENGDNVVIGDDQCRNSTSVDNNQDLQTELP